jgi:hypothetical protein
VVPQPNRANKIRDMPADEKPILTNGSWVRVQMKLFDENRVGHWQKMKSVVVMQLYSCRTDADIKCWLHRWIHNNETTICRRILWHRRWQLIIAWVVAVLIHEIFCHQAACADVNNWHSKISCLFIIVPNKLMTSAAGARPSVIARKSHFYCFQLCWVVCI